MMLYFFNKLAKNRQQAINKNSRFYGYFRYKQKPCLAAGFLRKAILRLTKLVSALMIKEILVFVNRD
ncbi:MAG: hypothetical protein CO027_02460 [Candidatus Komeilibacteria bacterium CG_4_9_14_0_2_um_filter_36_13]|nr:MAG: hypothetical protein CO027_02460 [Candidatus Komeilibacteria bacterium CG_4_9_14_0_2_um_filter_36_13]